MFSMINHGTFHAKYLVNKFLGTILPPNIIIAQAVRDEKKIFLFRLVSPIASTTVTFIYLIINYVRTSKNIHVIFSILYMNNLQISLFGICPNKCYVFSRKRNSAVFMLKENSNNQTS